MVIVRRFRFAARPGWVVGHVLVLAAVVTMILLGRWQLIVSNEKHFSLQNFGYAIQWWLFSLFAVFFWYRILRDQANQNEAPQQAEGGEEEEPQVEYRRYVMPTPPPSTRPGALGIQRLPGQARRTGREGAMSSPAFNLGKSLFDVRQPPVTPEALERAKGHLLRYRIMAFVTGVVLLAGTIALIIKYTTNLHMEPATGILWLGHGYLYLVYVIVTGILGFRLRWPLARYVARHARRHHPDDVLRRRALRHEADPTRRRSAGRGARLTAGQSGHQIRPRPGNPRPDRPHRAAADVSRLGIREPQHLGEHERLAALDIQPGDQHPHGHRPRMVRRARHWDRHGPVALRRPHMICTHPPRDRQQPGPCRRPPQEAMQRTERSGVGLLRQIVR